MCIPVNMGNRPAIVGTVNIEELGDPNAAVVDSPVTRL